MKLKTIANNVFGIHPVEGPNATIRLDAIGGNELTNGQHSDPGAQPETLDFK